MTTEEMIAANDFCAIHKIEYSFICSLEDAGLLQLVVMNEQRFIHHNQVNELEKMIRLYRELDVNIAGIEVIINLLNKIEEMQEEIRVLKNKVGFL